jgi:preprotein translocase subunit SecG
MESVLIVIQLLVVLALIIVILLQRSEGGGLGIGGGGQGAGLVSVRGTANLLTRATAILATAFFVTSIALAVISTNGPDGASSVLDQPGTAPAAPAAPAAPEQPAAPGVPLSE